ncbi:MAG: hypothetical protein KUL77_04350 [Thermomonas sp.]|jgi:hypothetical protein|uniref:hypothetical protein n=1 Tax=Thermomonas sp. TaxID=1971895 RepID=UPI001EB5309D|nr:hypothetical protein [Thermomonas sp.]MBV2208779.1 hypothetical protein [Thermomonas sp.]
MNVQTQTTRTFVERRNLPRSVAENRYQSHLGEGREFGIGYGRSSGYARVRSYVSQQPKLFRCS